MIKVSMRRNHGQAASHRTATRQNCGNTGADRRRVPKAAESLDRRGDEAAEFTAAEEVRYLDELRDDLEITEATLDLREIEAAADAEARESAGDGLAIVVGHTRSSPGAQGKAPPLPRNPDTARYEYTWNSELAEMIKQRAEASGIRCSVFFRDSGGITGAYARVRQWRPGATVELHFNAFNERARGPKPCSRFLARVHGRRHYRTSSSRFTTGEAPLTED